MCYQVLICWFFMIQLRMSTPWLSRPEKPEEMEEKIRLARRFVLLFALLKTKKKKKKEQWYNCAHNQYGLIGPHHKFVVVIHEALPCLSVCLSTMFDAQKFLHTRIGMQFYIQGKICINVHVILYFCFSNTRFTQQYK